MTIPVSPRSRYTAVYRSSTKYRETAQVSRNRIWCILAYSASPDPLAGLRGPTSKGTGGDGKGRGGVGKGREEEGEGRGRNHLR